MRRHGGTRHRSFGIEVKAPDDNEHIEGIRCLAGPVFIAQATPVALVGISGAKHRIQGSQIDEYGETIRRVSLEISAAFGFGVGTNPGHVRKTDPLKKGKRR